MAQEVMGVVDQTDESLGREFDDIEKATIQKDDSEKNEAISNLEKHDTKEDKDGIDAITNTSDEKEENTSEIDSEDKSNSEDVDGADDGDFEINNGVLTKYKGDDKDVFIPEGVTKIGGGCFFQSNIEKVFLSDSVKEIESFAFNDCNKLEHVDLNKVERLGGDAFYACSLSKIKIPKTLRHVDCESMYYPSTGHPYTHGGFNYGLEEVTFEEGITTIPEGVLSFTGVRSVKIPDTVTEIQRGAFCCSSLTEVELPESLKKIDSYAFRQCNLKEIIIPDSVTSIGEFAFQECKNLEKIRISKNIKEIGGGAFFACNKLDNVSIPKSLEKAHVFIRDDDSSFYYDNLSPFSECKNLKNVSFEEGISVIPDNIFLYCTGIENVTIPNSVTIIGDSAFSGCTNIKQLILPENLYEIGGDAFSRCKKIEDIKIPNTLTVSGAKFHRWGDTYVDGPFRGCSGLKNIVLEEGLKTIPYGLFYGCNSIKEIKIPDTVTEIGPYAFEGTGIENLEISAYVKKIGENALRISSLKTLTVRGKETVYDGNNPDYDDVFQFFPNDTTIYAYRDSIFFEKIKDQLDYYKFIPLEYVAAKDFCFESDKEVIKYNQSKKMRIEITPVGCSDVPFFKSSNESVVKIDSNGVMTGVGLGTAIIKVKVGKIVKSINVTVVNDVAEIKFEKNEISLDGGDDIALKATTNPKNVKLIWKSDNPLVATVDENGIVHAISKGSAKIIAKAAEGKGTAECKVNVVSNYYQISNLDDFQSAHGYGDESNDIWEYSLPDSRRLLVTFSHESEVEEEFDYLYVEDVDKNIVGTYTGKELADKTIEVPGNVVRVRLVSDESGTSYGFKVVSVVDPDAKQTCKSIMDLTVEDVNDYQYMGTDITPIPAVKDGKTILEAEKHYSLSYESNKNVGTGYVIISGNPENGYTDSRKVSFNILPFDISTNVGERFIVKCSKEAEFDEAGAKPKVTVTFKNADGTMVNLKEETDYILSYKNNTVVGSKETPIVTVEGKGNYSGKRSFEYTIIGKSLSKVRITASNRIHVSLPNSYKTVVVLSDEHGYLLPGRDYERALQYTYENNTNVKVAGKTVKRNAGDAIGAKDVIPAGTLIRVKAIAKKQGKYTGSVSTTYRLYSIQSIFEGIFK